MISFKDLGNYGRLGNQLFQMAATISLALKNNDKYIFPQWKEENYFNLDSCYSNNIVSAETYNEPYFHYCQIPYKQNLNLFGYFQSEKYFEDYIDLIKYFFTPKTKYPKLNNTTAIHIRRGDYIKFHEYHTNLDLSYYQKAINIIGSKKYMIFSDDISWCKSKFIGDNFLFSNKSPIEDFSLMLSCDHIIMANSSFSWWAAYLNENSSKIIVVPENWFGPKAAHNTKDLYLKNWIKI